MKNKRKIFFELMITMKIAPRVRQDILRICYYKTSPRQYSYRNIWFVQVPNWKNICDSAVEITLATALNVAPANHLALCLLGSLSIGIWTRDMSFVPDGVSNSCISLNKLIICCFSGGQNSAINNMAAVSSPSHDCTINTWLRFHSGSIRFVSYPLPLFARIRRYVSS